MRILLRDGELRPGIRGDLRLEGDRITAPSGPVDRIVDLEGRAVLPGFVDHHLHLFGLAAAEASIDLSPEALDAGGGLAAVLRRARRQRPHGWLRGIGYDVAATGPLDREPLDALGIGPVRIQDRTGILWILDGAALDAIGLGDGPAPSDGADRPEGIELRDGRPTGRLFRLDRWVGERVPRSVTALDTVASRLAALGIVGVTDAGANNGNEEHRAFAAANLPIEVTAMSRDATAEPVEGVRIGPVKILLDDTNLPPLDDLAHRIAAARSAGRSVAVHCVTPVQLVLALTAGVDRRDRIEHASWVPEDVLDLLVARNPTVIVQPGLVESRGDRYLAENDAADHADLHRLASLRRAGLRIAGSSDAPYGDPDPWAAIAAAVERRTRSGAPFGPDEALNVEEAVDLLTGSSDDPATPRRLVPGAVADLVIVDATWAEAARRPEVAATVRSGRVIAGAWPG